MPYLISILPFWYVWAILSILLIGFYFLMHFIFRNFFPLFIQPAEQSRTASGLMSLISVFYGILLGFMIITLWQNFSKIQLTVSDEASELAMIVRTASVLPAEAKEKIKKAVGNYITAVRTDEWKTMQLGRISSKAEKAITDLYMTILNYDPQTNHEKFFYNEIISKLNNVLKARRYRVDIITYPTPTLIIIILFIGAITLIMFLPTIAGFSTIGYQYFLNIALCLLIAFNLSVIIVLDHPFSGEWMVSDKAFSSGILAQFSDK